MGGSTGLGLFSLAADWRSNTSAHLFISTTSEVGTVRGPEIPAPLLSSTNTRAHSHTRTHTHTAVKLCKKAIQQIWPSKHKRDGLF